MTIRELIKRLEKCATEIGDNSHVMILDSDNGGGLKREINFGPLNLEIHQEDIDETCDCENIKKDTKVVVMGYGCY